MEAKLSTPQRSLITSVYVGRRGGERRGGRRGGEGGRDRGKNFFQFIRR